ncbi:MAG TPA: diacylglycerol kinase family protein [Verrucomicrobiae bacterium]|nr:diacylglycerol kinase family protein [Verrucomicrobiae bacterium]
MRTCVIFNPTAKGDKARNFRRHLNEIGAAAALKQTRCAGDARALATEAVSEGFEIIVAAGGDGTVNEVLNGIGDAPDGFARAALGVLPLGTVNVFARELKLSTKLARAWQVIRGGHEWRIDLPHVEYAENGGRSRRYFAQLAGAGLDARAIELVHWPLKKKIGPLAYVIAGLRAMMQSQATISVNVGGQTLSGELVLIGNGRLYGGEFSIFSKADLRDGELEVCVFPRVNWLTLARCGPGLLWNRRLPPRSTRNLKASSFTLSSASPAALEVDGEWIGHLPATFSIEPAKLRVIVPK